MLVAFTAMPFAAFVVPSRWWWLGVAAGVVATGRLMLARSDGASFVAFWTTFLCILALGIPWPVCFILPLVLGLSAARLWPWARELGSWFRWGGFPAHALGLMVIIIVGSSSALVAWFRLLGADVSDIVGALPRGIDWRLFWGGAVLFSAANALWEELLLKGMVWASLQKIMREGFGLNVLQAILFGFIHYHGFPRGISGALMAGFYGLLLGFLRLKSKGMLAVVVTHFFADMTICALLYARYTQSI